jgi:hypothetical protein
VIGVGYVIVHNITCRCFGFDGMIDGQPSFAPDHMFEF